MHSGPLAFLRMYLFYAKPWQQLVICAGSMLVGAALVIFTGQVGGILLIGFGLVAGARVARLSVRRRSGHG
jgi:hypothetical protein